MKPAFKSSPLFLLAILFSLQVSAQKKYVAPALSQAGSWSMVLVPDTQNYVKFGRNQPLLELMTSWIGEQIDALNIRMVLCTGDLVDQNEMINPQGHNGDQTSKAQWESVSRAFSRLDGRVPYVTAAGNHDYGYANIARRHTNFNKYFPVDKNFQNQKLLKEVMNNAEGIPTLENAAFAFTSPHGKKFLVMSLEFAPRDTVLNWAAKVLAQEKYKDHQVIILTHSYLNAKNEHIVKEDYPIQEGNYGAAMWEKLVKPSRNIQLVVSGHICAPDDAKAHIGFRTDTNAAGKKVHQMAFNAQAMGGGWHGNGGDGWLRLLEFLPDGRTVKVKTFSPFFAISPATQDKAWRQAAHDEFTFQLD